MQFTSYAKSLHDLNHLCENGLKEVILGHRDFNRFGTLDDDVYSSLAARARDLGLRVIFEWDILMTEKSFSEVSSRLNSYSFDVLRVQDPGALEFGLKQTSVPLQFIAENGNHNLIGLQSWVRYCGDRLERLVLSIELSHDKIVEYVKALPVKCELLGLGRILLFYTPRALLSPLKIASNEVLGSSEESPHKGFPIVENRHGTFMFHIKEFCLIEFLSELQDLVIRIDTRWSEMSWLGKVVRGEFVKDDYPQEVLKGFYHVNKTDVLFPKLKNSRLQKREGNYVGEVLEAEKGSHLAIQIRNPSGLKLGQTLQFMNPLGKVVEAKVFELKNGSLQSTNEVGPGLAIIQFVGGTGPKSQVFYT